MGTHNKFTNDLFMVIGSNIIVLCSSILTGLFIPRLLGVTEYGYYKIFSLYLGYSGLLHFGFVDGILLRFAGWCYSKLDRSKFRGYTHFFFFFQLIVSCTISVISVLFIPSAYKFIFLMLGMDVFAVNMITYYQFISQSVMRFKELSVIKILLALGKMVLILFIAYIQRYKDITPTANTYIMGLVILDFVLLLWYVVCYRDISFGARAFIRVNWSDIRKFFIDGIVLTLSYQTSQIVFLLDRQFVSTLFDTETYSVYSFAYSLIAMVTTVVSAFSQVLFPRLKQMNHNTLMLSYSKSLAGVCIVSFGALIGYQPLCWFIKWYLPNYSVALDYLKILFPGLAVSCSISIVMFTYYKALNIHSVFFRICCIVLIIGCILNYFSFSLFHSPSSISVASIITLIVWYFINELYLVRLFHIHWIKNLLYIGIMMCIFYYLNYHIINSLFSWILYICIYLIVSICLNKNLLYEIIPVFKVRSHTSQSSNS